MQPVLGLVRERDAREPEEGRGARAERGEPLLRGAPALRGKLPEPATAGRAAADAAAEAARAACDARRNMPGADLWGRRRGRRP